MNLLWLGFARSAVLAVLGATFSAQLYAASLKSPNNQKLGRGVCISAKNLARIETRKADDFVLGKIVFNSPSGETSLNYYVGTAPDSYDSLQETKADLHNVEGRPVTRREYRSGLVAYSVRFASKKPNGVDQFAEFYIRPSASADLDASIRESVLGVSSCME